MNPPLLSAPLYTVWEINKLCNAECLHCYTDSGPLADEHGILTTAECFKVIDELKKLKILHVGLSGGEPLLRPDCLDIIQRLSEAGVFVSVATNGKIITKNLAKALKDSGVDSVCLSIDSHRAETHDYIRRSPGLFNQAIKASKTLLEGGLKVVVGMTAMKYNFKEEENFINFVLNLGITSVNITGFVPVGRGIPTHDLDREELSYFLTRMNHYRNKYIGKIDIAWHDCRFALINEECKDFTFKGCGAANTTCRITFNGNVTPCSTLPLSGGNLKEKPFTEIWFNSRLFKDIRDRRNLRDGTNCKECDFLRECGGCRAIAYAYFNDPFSGNPHCWLYKGE